jgi:type VI secretion system protein
MAVTLKFQSSGMVPGNGSPVMMRGGSLTVGRGPGNDLTLPDPDRVLSKNHFAIEDHNGRVVIVDFSTNGTFLNYSKVPIGRTPTPLNNGDVLSVGGYELVVEIGQDLPDLDDLIAPSSGRDDFPGNADSAQDPFDMLDVAGPEGDFLDELLGAEGGPTGHKQIDTSDPIDDLLPPLGEEEDPFFNKPSDGRDGEGASFSMHNPSVFDNFAPSGKSDPGMIPDDWDDLLAPDGADLGAPESPIAEPPPQPPKIPVEAVQEPVAKPAVPYRAPPQTDTVVPARVAASGDQSAARAFLNALETDDLVIADEDLERTMARMGRVMRMMIIGLREVLMTRTSIKSEFRIDQTMISAGGNNPLKFSLSEDHAVEALVKPKAKGYLSPETATEQALDDIKAHEIAMVTGMEAAIKGVLGKLDPDVLAGQIETSNAFGSMFKGKKARYWEVYEKMYAQISDQAENDFHELFSREFARAYKEQLDKLK